MPPKALSRFTERGAARLSVEGLTLSRDTVTDERALPLETFHSGVRTPETAKSKNTVLHRADGVPVRTHGPCSGRLAEANGCATEP